MITSQRCDEDGVEVRRGGLVYSRSGNYFRTQVQLPRQASSVAQDAISEIKGTFGVPRVELTLDADGTPLELVIYNNDIVD